MDQMKIRLKLLEQLEAGHLDQPGQDDPCRSVFDSLLSDGYIAIKRQPPAAGDFPTYRLTESGRTLLVTLRAAYQSE
jgi:hypothetical protein